MSDALKSCPFCGFNDFLGEVCHRAMDSRHFWTVCPSCHACGPRAPQNETLIAGIWNTRAEVAKPVVKMPRRYRVGSGDDGDGSMYDYDYEDESDGGKWMKAEDVLALLKAAGVEVVP